jgi:plastocyanin
MPNIFKAASVNLEGLRARLGFALCGILAAVIVATGISRAIAAKVPAPDYVVKMENMNFSPAALTVRSGERIEFKNLDLVPHTVTAKSAGTFDSGLVKPGESWTFTAKVAGSFSYACSFHPMMVGELTVTQR